MDARTILCTEVGGWEVHWIHGWMDRGTIPCTKGREGEGRYIGYTGGWTGGRLRRTGGWMEWKDDPVRAGRERGGTLDTLVDGQRDDSVHGGSGGGRYIGHTGGWAGGCLR